MQGDKPENGPEHGKRLVFRHDVSYTSQAGEKFPPAEFSHTDIFSRTDAIVRRLRERLTPRGLDVLYSNIHRKQDLPIAGRAGPEAQVVAAMQQVTLEHASMQADDAILYVGGESLGLTNLLMTHASCEASPHLISPSTALRLSPCPCS
jgi:diphthamide biosynthesis protein 2